MKRRSPTVPTSILRDAWDFGLAGPSIGSRVRGHGLSDFTSGSPNYQFSSLHRWHAKCSQKPATAWPECRHLLAGLTLLLAVNVAAQDNDSCQQATSFSYFHCENYDPTTTFDATLCYLFHTAGSEVDFNFGYFAYCPDLEVSYTLYNPLCDSITSNTTGYFDIAPEVYYIICGTVACGQASGLGIAQVCTAELLALPVEVTAFVAFPTDAGVVLQWTTASESGSAAFEVFRMTTAGDRGTLLTSLRAAGYSHGAITYRWTDTKPEAGLRYYRLEGVDIDGVRRVLRILPVTWEGKASSLGPWDLLGRRVKP